MVIRDDTFVPGACAHSASLELDCSAEEAFALLCAVEKWPVWLSFLRSARRANHEPKLDLGSEVIIRSWLPGEEEEVFEIDGLIATDPAPAYQRAGRSDQRVLDGVFERHEQDGSPAESLLRKRGKCRGFARARRAAYEHEPVGQHR